MRSRYEPDVKCCCDYYEAQAGGAIPYYSGSTMQHGGGIGDVLKGLFKSAVPIIKSVGKQVLPRLARAGLQTLSDVVVRKQNPKDAFLTRTGTEIQGLMNNTIKGSQGRQKQKKRKRKSRPQVLAKRPKLKENY